MDTVIPTNQAFPKILGLRRAAIMEICLFLGLMLAVDMVFGQGHRFFSTYPHPFWIIILLVSAQYGINEGLLCAALCTVALLVGNMPYWSLHESLYDYYWVVSQRPLMWFVAVVVLGQIKSKYVYELSALRKAHTEAVFREETITNAYERLKEGKESLEIRLATQLKSVATAYDAIRKIEISNQAQLLLAIEDIVKEVLQPKKFSIFSVGDIGLEAAIYSGWEEDEAFLRRFDNHSSIYHEVVNKKRLLCVVNSDDIKILGDEGQLAAPLIDPETDQVFAMIKLEKIDYATLNLSNVYAFKALCDWIGKAYVNARRHQKLKLRSIENDETGVYTHVYYKTFIELFTKLQECGGMHYCQVKLKITNYHALKRKLLDRKTVAKLLSTEVANVSLCQGALFESEKPNRQYYVVLFGQNQAILGQACVALSDAVKAHDQLGQLEMEFES